MNENFQTEEIKTLSPLILAHVGDAYFHLYIRTRLLQVTHNITRLHDYRRFIFTLCEKFW